MRISSVTIKFDSSSVMRLRLELSFFRSSSLKELFYFLGLFFSFLFDNRSPLLEEAFLFPAWSEKWTDFVGLLLCLLVLARRCLVGEFEEMEDYLKICTGTAGCCTLVTFLSWRFETFLNDFNGEKFWFLNSCIKFTKSSFLTFLVAAGTIAAY